jgi:acetyl-CoA carboxylase biotin carboxyl carrier protein
MNEKTKMNDKPGNKPFNSDLVRQIAALLEETKLTEIEVEENGLRVRVVRNAAPMQVGPPVAAATTPTVQAPANINTEAPQGAVTSPMVGTAYMSSAPSKPNFIEVGSAVKQGQTLLIIEAMKTFNEIPSPRAGKVTQILVENGQPVEFGMPLVVIA